MLIRWIVLFFSVESMAHSALALPAKNARCLAAIAERTISAAEHTALQNGLQKFARLSTFIDQSTSGANKELSAAHYSRAIDLYIQASQDFRRGDQTGLQWRQGVTDSKIGTSAFVSSMATAEGIKNLSGKMVVYVDYKSVKGGTGTLRLISGKVLTATPISEARAETMGAQLFNNFEPVTALSILGEDGQVHNILSNLGNLFRYDEKFDQLRGDAKDIETKFFAQQAAGRKPQEPHRLFDDWGKPSFYNNDLPPQLKNQSFDLTKLAPDQKGAFGIDNHLTVVSVMKLKDGSRVMLTSIASRQKGAQQQLAEVKSSMENWDQKPYGRSNYLGAVKNGDGNLVVVQEYPSDMSLGTLMKEEFFDRGNFSKYFGDRRPEDIYLQMKQLQDKVQPLVPLMTFFDSKSGQFYTTDTTKQPANAKPLSRESIAFDPVSRRFDRVLQQIESLAFD